MTVPVPIPPFCMLTAKQWIDSGMATDVIVVATDISATPENVRPFVDLGVCVADRAPLDGCRPFQEGSGGFIVGEASVAMVLSSSPRGGYAGVLGGAMTQDAHHVISIDPTLAQLRRCWTTALNNAGVDARDVAYLNAHGPGTRQCDTAEAAAFLVQRSVDLEQQRYAVAPTGPDARRKIQIVAFVDHVWTEAPQRPPELAQVLERVTQLEDFVQRLREPALEHGDETRVRAEGLALDVARPDDLDLVAERAQRVHHLLEVHELPVFRPDPMVVEDSHAARAASCSNRLS